MPDPAEVSPMTNEKKLRVLLIEDDSIDRESVHRAISSRFELIDAEDGYSGVEKARTDRPDCVLLDYRLPDIDGIQILPKFVQEGIPVVMMTGVGSESIAVDAMKHGAHDYISKDAVSSSLLGKMIDQAIKSGELQLQLAKQQEELRNFVSVASHDLRAPLRHILQSAKFAKEECEGIVSDQVRTYLTRVVDSASRMTSLLDALVEFARSGRNAVSLEPVDLNKVVEVVRTLLHENIERSNAQINIGNLPVVKGHEPSLIELIQNIIENAIKYAGDRDPIINVDSSCHGKTWTISIEDNGIGIAEKYYAKVFLPFRRLHSFNDVEGSGIGLATCKRIVEHHGGTIWIQSEVDRGTTFLFTLEEVDDSDAACSEKESLVTS